MMNFFFEKYIVLDIFEKGNCSICARFSLAFARNWMKNYARKMIYASSVLLALEATRKIFCSSSARLENWFCNFCSCSARLENFFARLARAQKIYARTQHYFKTSFSFPANAAQCKGYKPLELRSLTSAPFMIKVLMPDMSFHFTASWSGV